MNDCVADDSTFGDRLLILIEGVGIPAAILLQRLVLFDEKARLLLGTLIPGDDDYTNHSIPNIELDYSC